MLGIGLLLLRRRHGGISLYFDGMLALKRSLPY